MSDIVERLRAMVDRRQRHEYEIGHYWNAVEEAADEIERLRSFHEDELTWRRNAERELAAIRDTPRVDAVMDGIRSVLPDALSDGNLCELADVARQLERELAARTDDAYVSTAAGDVLNERKRQIEVEGWTADHDDEHHPSEELAIAAACYALNATWLKHIGQKELVQKYWPWDVTWWKPKDPRRDLIRAAALIVAEIERIDRAALSSEHTSGGAG